MSRIVFNKYIYVIFSIVMGLTSCNWEVHKGREVVTTDYYSNKKIKSIKTVTLIGDSIVRGDEKEYYPNGNLRRTASIQQGGICGNVIEYYVNGEILSKKEFVNGKPYGEAIWYYETGELKTYGFYKENLLYRAHYDITGCITDDESSAIVLLQTNTEGEIGNSIRINEVFELEVNYKTPPNYVSIITAGVSDSNGNYLVDPDTINKNDTSGFFSTHFDTTGRHYIRIDQFLNPLRAECDTFGSYYMLMIEVNK